jgi:hypothetical protein
MRSLALAVWGALLGMGFAQPSPAFAQTSTTNQSLFRLQEAIASGRLGDLALATSDEHRAVRRCTFTNTSWTVKIEVLSGLERESAEALIKDGIMGVHALFADALSPYPGDISHRVVTSKRFAPEYRERPLERGAYRYFLLYANECQAYGATSQDAVRFRSLLGWIHDDSGGRLYKVRCFAPLDTANDALESWFLSLRGS